MTALSAVARRARCPDVLQALALFLAALLFVLAVRWPGGGGANETWFALAPTRAALLALIAMGFGAAEAREPPARRRATAGAVLVFVVASVPFEVASYAASYPAVPLWWPSVLPFIETFAYFCLGTALARAAALARLDAFLTLLVPLTLIAATWLDVRLGLDLLNPLTSSQSVAWPHALLMVALAVAGAVWLAWPGRRAAATDGEGASAP